jgi:hypothetical protein
MRWVPARCVAAPGMTVDCEGFLYVADQTRGADCRPLRPDGRHPSEAGKERHLQRSIRRPRFADVVCHIPRKGLPAAHQEQRHVPMGGRDAAASTDVMADSTGVDYLRSTSAIGPLRVVVGVVLCLAAGAQPRDTSTGDLDSSFCRARLYHLHRHNARQYLSRREPTVSGTHSLRWRLKTRGGAAPRSGRRSRLDLGEAACRSAERCEAPVGARGALLPFERADSDKTPT